MTWLKKLKFQHLFRKDLDVILEQVPAPTAPIRVRMNWLADLMQWIRSQGMISHQMDFASGTPQALRVKYLMQVLQRNPDWRNRCGETLCSILSEAWMTSLFATTGLIARESFWSEVLTRLGRKILPNRPFDRDFKYFTEVVFSGEHDDLWVRRIDEATVQQIAEWIHGSPGGGEPIWQHIRKEERQALLILSGHLRSMGFHPKIWNRIDSRLVLDNPFFILDCLVTGALLTNEITDELQAEVTKAKSKSRDFLGVITDHLDDFGVDLETVFLLDRMELALKRFTGLWQLINSQRSQVQSVHFLADLIKQSHERRSLRGLFSESFALISRDITERCAETGENYITRNWAGFRTMLRKGLGGGAVMAVTTLVKFGITSIAMAGVLTGFFASVNYALSFVAIHLLGWTLATKQPANTGPALASRMMKLDEEGEFENLIQDIIHLIRTQVIGVVGNVVAVLPLTALICFVYMETTNYPLISEYKALATVNSFSVIGPTPFFAAFTGVLLWASAVFAGWADNWFAYHRLYRAIRHNRRLIFAFGERNTAVAALWLRKNIAPLAGNISLGILLGSIPVFLSFFGIPLDVRHVTLAAGGLGAALSTLSVGEVSWLALLLAVLGISAAGLLNIFVSFFLALAVALKARRIDTPDQARIFRALRKRFMAHPLTFFIPSRDTSVARGHGAD